MRRPCRARRWLRTLAGMRKLVWPSVGVLLISLLAAGLSAASGLKLWWAFGIVAGAVLVNGLVAMLEDDLPGGFNNPDGTHTPRYAVITAWTFRAIVGVFVVLCVVALGLYFFG